MDFKNITESIDRLSDKIKTYESGDLMGLSDIKSGYEDLKKSMSGEPGFKDIIKFIDLECGIIDKMAFPEWENEIAEILKKSNESLANLFGKKVSGKETAVIINGLIARIVTLQNGLNQPGGSDLYPENYFANIVNNIKMLSQLTDEVKDMLDEAQCTLVELEFDDTNQENINKVFRDFHTIKGSSAFLGLKNIEDVAHDIESLLVLVRDNKLRITKELIDVVFFGIEMLRNIVHIMEADEFDAKKMIDSFKKIDIFEYISVLRVIVEKYNVKKIGDILLEEGKLKSLDINNILSRQTSYNKKFGEIAVDEKLVSEDDIKEAIDIQQKSAVKKSSYVKVSYNRLNSLIDIVGELVINQSMLRQQLSSAVDAERTIYQLEQITSTIKNLVLSMGMVPIADIFNRLRVVIRKTSQDLNKAVVMELHGEETELDRNVMEAVYDPLVHIVRNSIDHGIEMPDVRESLKKDRVGRVIISAEQKGNGIEISVFDDGRGIDREKVLKTAVSKRLISEENAADMTDEDVHKLLFLPGFSTVEKPTEVSGRGVGMDVVKQNIESIHGKVEISTSRNEYTRFVIKLPLTLAIIEGFVTVVGVNKYVFPFHSIDEIIVPEEKSFNNVDNGGLMIFNRGEYIPVIESGKIFKEYDYKKNMAENILIVISYDNRKYAIAVDRVVGKFEIVIKNMGEALANLDYYSGGTIFGDGTIGFVVDIDGFLKNAKDVL